MPINHCPESLFTCSSESFNLLTALEHNKRRHGLDIALLADVVCLINVALEEFNGVLVCRFVSHRHEDWSDLLAWRAPSRCEVYNHGLSSCCLRYQFLELLLVCDVGHLSGCFTRSVTHAHRGPVRPDRCTSSLIHVFNNSWLLLGRLILLQSFIF